MLWAAIPAFLKTKFEVSEILTSLMLTYVATLVLSILVHGPWRDPEGFNFPQSRMFTEAAILPVILEGTRLHVGALVALFAAAAAWVLLSYTVTGFQIKVVGQAPMAARFAGFSQKRTVWFTLLLAGALAGLAGMIEVAGPIGQLTPATHPRLRLHRDHRGLPRPPQPDWHRPGRSGHGDLLHRRRERPGLCPIAASGDGCVPGNAAVLPARLGFPRPLPRPHPIRQAPPGGRHGMIDFLVLITVSIVIAATPMLFAAVGELVAERSGVLNLGVEGMMLIGAVVGFGVTMSTGSAILGIGSAALAGAALALGLRRAGADPDGQSGGDRPCA